MNKLQSVNVKLRGKLKELNDLLQRQLERKGSPSPVKNKGSASPRPDDNAEAHHLRIKEQELANVHK
jgi:hypothetical protein